MLVYVVGMFVTVAEEKLCGEIGELLLRANEDESEYGMPVLELIGETLIPLPVAVGQVLFVNGTVIVE